MSPKKIVEKSLPLEVFLFKFITLQWQIKRLIYKKKWLHKVINTFLTELNRSSSSQLHSIVVEASPKSCL